MSVVPFASLAPSTSSPASPASAVTVDKDVLAADLHAYAQELEYRSSNVARLSKRLPDKPEVKEVRDILQQRQELLTNTAAICLKARESVCVAT